ncbi:hypothetical protein ACLOJK_038322, partial [Asimina triloba]
TFRHIEYSPTAIALATKENLPSLRASAYAPAASSASRIVHKDTFAPATLLASRPVHKATSAPAASSTPPPVHKAASAHTTSSASRPVHKATVTPVVSSVSWAIHKAASSASRPTPKATSAPIASWASRLIHKATYSPAASSASQLIHKAVFALAAPLSFRPSSTKTCPSTLQKVKRPSSISKRTTRLNRRDAQPLPPGPWYSLPSSKNQRVKKKMATPVKRGDLPPRWCYPPLRHNTYPRLIPDY